MKVNWTCQEVRLNLAAYREGWLGEQDRGTFRSHLEECASCAAELARDEELATWIADIRDERVEAPSFEELLHRSDRQTTTRIMPHLAFGSGMAALLLVALVVWTGRDNNRTDSPTAIMSQQEVALPTQAFSDAHLMLSSSEFASDPNRAVLLAHVHGHAKEATP